MPKTVLGGEGGYEGSRETQNAGTQEFAASDAGGFLHLENGLSASPPSSPLLLYSVATTPNVSAGSQAAFPNSDTTHSDDAKG